MVNHSLLNLTIIDDINDLPYISEEWTALNNTIPSSTLFNSPYWLLTWIDQYWQTEWQLCLITLRNNKGELVALAPFYIQSTKVMYGLRKLYPLGQGEPESAEVSSEYSNILILPKIEKIVLTELEKALKTLKVDQILWRAVLKESHINSLLIKTYNYSKQNEFARYIVDKSKWKLARLSKNTRSRYKRSLNQLERINAHFHWVSEANFEAYFETLIYYHQTRWNNKNKKGAFFSSQFIAFHKKLKNINTTELIKISAITINGQPIAINYYLKDDTTLYFYQCGWDEENYSNYSLGMALHLWSIQHCEHKYYDFMMGNMNDSYKGKFGCEKIPMTNIKINLSPKKFFLNKVLNKIFNSLKTD